MKNIFIILTITLNLCAQDPEQAKIDMHGGMYDNYNSIGGYKDGGFRKSVQYSIFSDTNSTKSIDKKYSKVK